MFYRRPSSSWLDRLRSSKGIPVNNDLNLEQFLTQNPNLSDTLSIPNQSQIKSNPNSIPDEKWFSNMSNVLAELFVMDGDSHQSRGFTRRKSSRKQSNPKIFIPPATVGNNEEGRKVVEEGGDGGDGGVVEVMSGSNSVAEDKEKTDLSGYSRSDLMIIDTSSDVWKAEKLVLRKGNVWKVKERDSKSRNFLARKKKRKLKQFDDDESEDEKKKKKKKKMKKMKKMKEKKKKKLMLSLNRSPKADGGDQCRASTLKELAENGDVGANEETQQNPDQSSMKRCKYLSSPGKPAKKNRLCT